jgi:hypothetical protein
LVVPANQSATLRAPLPAHALVDQSLQLEGREPQFVGRQTGHRLARHEADGLVAESKGGLHETRFIELVFGMQRHREDFSKIVGEQVLRDNSTSSRGPTRCTASG